jgi:hypothetical protein
MKNFDLFLKVELVAQGALPDEGRTRQVTAVATFVPLKGATPEWLREAFGEAQAEVNAALLRSSLLTASKAGKP